MVSVHGNSATLELAVNGKSKGRGTHPGNPGPGSGDGGGGVGPRTPEPKAVSFAEWVAGLVESAPPLTPEQRSRLSLLLRPETT